MIEPSCNGALALEPRILLDAAAVETAEAVQQSVSADTVASQSDDQALLASLNASVLTASPSQPELTADADGSSTDQNGAYLTRYTENGEPVSVVDSDVAITGDEKIAHIIVTLANAFPTDVLEVSIPDELGVGAYQTTTGGTISLFLSGDASADQWEEALQHIRFRAGTENPDATPRIVTIDMQDESGAYAETVTTIIDVIPVEDKPVVDLDPLDRTRIGIDHFTTYVENGDSVSIGHDADGVSVVDVDDETIASLRVTIANAAEGDALIYPSGLPAALTLDPVSTDTTIVLTGLASRSVYQDAIEAIRFLNSSENPDTTLREIRVQVNDGQADSPVAKTYVAVEARNDPPVLVGRAEDQTAVDAQAMGTITVTPVFFDADGEALTYSLGPGAPSWLGIDPSTGTVANIAPLPVDASQHTNHAGNPAGTYSVTVIATDGAGESAADTFDIVVSNPEPTAENDRFTIDEDVPELLGNVMADNGEGRDLDPDGDPIAVIAVGGEEDNVGAPLAGSNGGLFVIRSDGGFTFSENGDFQSLAEGESVTSWVSYRIRDADGASSAALVEVTVTGRNDGPTSTADIVDRVGWDGETVPPIDLSSFFTDIDHNDSLTFSAAGLPEGLSFDPSSGVLSGVLAADASQKGNAGLSTDGLYSVEITAHDAAGAAVSQTFLYRVGNPDPVATDDMMTVTDQGQGSINLIHDDTGRGGDTDPDGDAPLTVIAIDGDHGRVGQSFAGSNGGVFTVQSDGTLTFDTNGEFIALPKGRSATTALTYTLSDGQGGESTATVTIVVIGENQPPQPIDPDGKTPSDPAAYIPVQSSLDGETITPLDLTPFATDPDRGDTLTFTIDETALPSGLHFDGTIITGTLSADASQLGTDPGSPGIYKIPLTVTDSHGASFSTWITYDVRNVPPIALDNASSGDFGDIQTGNVIRDADGPDHDGAPDNDPVFVTRLLPVDPKTGAVLNNPASGQPFQAVDLPARGAAFLSLPYGQLQMTSDGAWSFAPGDLAAAIPSGEAVIIAFQYQLSDGQGGFDEAVLRLVIEGEKEDGIAKPPEDPDEPEDEAERLLGLSGIRTLGILDVVDGNRVFSEALLQRQAELVAEGDALYRGAQIELATSDGDGKITVRSVVWKDRVYVELLGPVDTWSVSDASGGDAPEWIRQSDANFIEIAAGRPNGVNEVVIGATLRDGRMLNLPLKIDQTSGVMTAGRLSETPLIDRPVGDQLDHMRESGAIEESRLLKALSD
ncbi:putative Ig domain-containing protein [Notoacmeibacter ruber]|uniref:Cadherin domain-containing protein n=1 Tax=Notoacmeibacter ruber TaxID=2670375 RepID=A0A3L7J9X1_9HYPH|nr:putative Ig domain-containing protein [Notoacmeibacter ruber]RLQ87155.1 hypothetical protein D8780_01930 [Notoacmeibacter ruber]